MASDDDSYATSYVEIRDSVLRGIIGRALNPALTETRYVAAVIFRPDREAWIICMEPDIMKLAEAKRTKRMTQARSEIRELPTDA
jgi:hypothetical protein